MTAAQYAIIQIVADPARDEPMNVGALVWQHSSVVFKIDQDAVADVILRNPHLTYDALSFLEEYVQAVLGDAVAQQEDVAETLARLSSFPISVSEPRFLAIPDRSRESMGVELDRLVKRLVEPPRAKRLGRRGFRDEVKKELKPLVKHGLLKTNFRFTSTRSGSPWSVDYFANSDANLVLDVLSLAVSDATTILQRAAAHAFKMHDVLTENQVTYVVLCQFVQDERFIGPNERARAFLETVGAEVEHDLHRTIDRIRGALPLPLERARSASVTPVGLAEKPEESVRPKRR